jgi:polyhydroxybutyrate depolymerase
MIRQFVLALAVFFATVPVARCEPYRPEKRDGDMAEQVLSVNGKERHFFYHLPKGYAGAPTPMVFFFHGGGGHAIPFAANIHCVATSDENNFIVIAPQGVDAHWNYGVKVRGKQNEDDVRFVNQIIDYMQNHYNVDPRRVYIAGFSDGGWFTQWLTYQIPEKVAAAGVVCALETEQSQVTFGYSHPRLPVIFMLGTSDPRMLWRGGETPNGTHVISADATVWSWVRADRCLTFGRLELFPNICTTDNSRVEATFYGGNDSFRADVAFYKVIGGGHAWPGAVKTTSADGNVNEDIDATQQIWNFFKAHPKLVPNEPPPFPRLTVVD